MSLSPLWSALTAALALLTMAAVLRRSPVLAREVDAPSAVRVGTIDGLRFYLAFGVFLTHALSIRGWSAGKGWDWPPSAFYTLCGTAPVTLFFMLTGFLFWSKAIRGSVQLRPAAFYAARLRRLGPLYLALFPPFLLLAAAWSGFAWHAPVEDNARSLFCWAAFGICGPTPLNGIPDVWVANPPIWTLRFEWYFYLALPLLAWCATPLRSIGLALLALVALHRFPEYAMMRNFLFGGFAAFVVQGGRASAALRSRGFAALALLGLVAAGSTEAVQYGLPHEGLVFPTLLAACAGNPFFGLLSMRPARALGAVSYSVYLGHCLVLQVTTAAAQALGWLPALGSPLYWIYVEIVTVLVVLGSAATFRFVEFPFLAPSNRGLNREGAAHARDGASAAPAADPSCGAGPIHA